MDLHPNDRKLRSRTFDKFVKLDRGGIGYEGIWFYTAPYFIEPWLDHLVTHLPRWINASCNLKGEVTDALVGDHSKL